MATVKMKELLDKLSSYNLFNYLFPGVVFVAILDKVSSYHLVQKDIVIGVFLYYFIGLIISRVGSIVIEPILKKLKFLEFSDYAEYVKASQKDVSLATLSETNNMYRTLCSMFFCLAVTIFFEHITPNFLWLQTWWSEVLVVALFSLFVLSYRKQTAYISKRVNANKAD